MSPRISIRLLSAQSDQRLAALAEEGHERAFEALVHRYRRPLLRYCQRMQLSDARAEDVLQQAFLQAWMAFARGTKVREVRPWLYRIVHNAAVNAMRGPADGHSELTEAMQAKAALAGESELQRKMAVHEALADVAALPQMQQQAIFLTAVDGQSHDEVASVLGVSEGALRGLLYRARASLRSAAAALTPPPLLEWAARGADNAGPTAERIAELSAGGGAAGMAGLLLKGAVVAVTAGAVATGASVVNSHGQGNRPAARRTTTVAVARSTADRRRATRGAVPVGASSMASSSSEHAGQVGGRRRAGRRDGSNGDSGARDEDRSSSSSDNGSGASPSDGGGRDVQTQGSSGSGGRDPSESSGSGSPGSTTADGDHSGSSGSASPDGGGDSGREASTTDGGGQPTVTSGGSSGGGSGSSSDAAVAAAPLAAVDTSGGGELTPAG